MATIIGTFTKTENGFTGAVKTLYPQRQGAARPSEKTSDKAPGLPHLRRSDRARRP